MAHLSIPILYTLYLAEVASRQDVEDCAKLMVASALKFGKDVDINRG